ncbi:hypothetical protein HDV05_001625 [Chytridiales sp. JEL 0842]|nr:hypothetical protein HDV05_001625 [Chytridiales sp. JEL 0842]
MSLVAASRRWLAGIGGTTGSWRNAAGIRDRSLERFRPTSSNVNTNSNSNNKFPQIHIHTESNSPIPSTAATQSNLAPIEPEPTDPSLPLLIQFRTLATQVTDTQTANQLVGLSHVFRKNGVVLDPQDQAIVIRAHGTLGNWLECVNLYENLKRNHSNDNNGNSSPTSAMPRDVLLYRSVTRACAKLGYLKLAMKVLKELEQHEPAECLESYETLIMSLVAHRDISTAIRLFKRMKERDGGEGSLVPTPKIYGALVAGLTENRDSVGALNLYSEMNASGIDPETSMEFLESLTIMHCKLFRLESAKDVLEQMKQLFKSGDEDSLLRSYTALMDGVIKKGMHSKDMSNLVAGERILHELKQFGLQPNLITHTVMLYGYYKYGGLERLLSYYQTMLEAGFEPDQHVYNILIRAHVLDELSDSAISVYEEMISKNLQPNAKVLTSLMTAFALQGNMNHAVAAFDELESMGVRPDHALFHVIMNGYAHSMDISNSLAWYNRLLGAGLRPNVVTYTILMYGVSRSIDPEATSRWYSRMFSADVRPNVYTYSLLMHDRARRGEVAAAAHIYQEMIQSGVTPNSVTFATLLNTYVKNFNHQEALEVFNLMIAEGSQPDAKLYHVIMRMFAGLEQWNQVISIYENLQQNMVEPDNPIYLTAFTAYINLRKFELASGILDSVAKRSQRIGSATSSSSHIPPQFVEVALNRVAKIMRNPNQETLEDLKTLFDTLYNKFKANRQHHTPSKDFLERLLEYMLLAHSNVADTWFLNTATSIFKDGVIHRKTLSSNIKARLFNTLLSANDVGGVAEVLGAMAVSGNENYDPQYVERSLEPLLSSNVDVFEKLASFWKSVMLSASTCLEERTSLQSESGEDHANRRKPASAISSNVLKGILSTMLNGLNNPDHLRLLWNSLYDHQCPLTIDIELLLLYVSNLCRLREWADVVRVATIETRETVKYVDSDFISAVCDILEMSNSKEYSERVKSYWEAQA